MQRPTNHLFMRLKRIPKKHLYEVLLTVGALALVGLLVALISPYSPKQEYAFLDSGVSASSTLYRAQVKTASETALTVILRDGPRKGSTFTIPYGESRNNEKPSPGASIIVFEDARSSALTFYDRYRIPGLLVLIALFIAVVLLVGRRKGAMSLAGLGASIVVIGWVIVPLVVAGYNSLLVSVLGAYLIAIVSILLAHGFHRRTLISLLCVLIVLVIVTIGSQAAVAILGLTGVVDDAGYYLQFDHAEIDLSGILVGGIVIAALGALDDIVTTQVATVDELKKANKTLSVHELYRRASSVGGEHIAALVNTLALVYVGAALPVIVAYAVSNPRLFALFNGEFVATEITRTVIVSIGLVIAVPISTLIASLLIYRHFEKS